MTRSSIPEILDTLHGKILRETDAAIQIEVDAVNQTPLKSPEIEWFPLSQVTKIWKCAGTSTEKDYITVKHWLLLKKGLA